MSAVWGEVCYGVVHAQKQEACGGYQGRAGGCEGTAKEVEDRSL